MNFFHHFKKKIYLLSPLLLLIIIALTIGLLVNKPKGTTFNLQTTTQIKSFPDKKQQTLLNIVQKFGNAQTLYSETKVDPKFLDKRFIDNDSQIGKYYPETDSRTGFFPALNRNLIDLSEKTWMARNQKIIVLNDQSDREIAQVPENLADQVNNWFQQYDNLQNIIKIDKNYNQLTRNFLIDNLNNFYELLGNFKMPRQKIRIIYNNVSTNLENGLNFVSSDVSDKYFEGLTKFGKLAINLMDNIHSITNSYQKYEKTDPQFNQIVNLMLFFHHQLQELSDAEQQKIMTAINNIAENNFSDSHIDKNIIQDENVPDLRLEPFYDISFKIKDFLTDSQWINLNRNELIAKFETWKNKIVPFQQTLLTRWTETFSQIYLQNIAHQIFEEAGLEVWLPIIKKLITGEEINWRNAGTTIFFAPQTEQFVHSFLNWCHFIMFRKNFLEQKQIPKDYYHLLTANLKALDHVTHNDWQYLLGQIVVELQKTPTLTKIATELKLPANAVNLILKLLDPKENFESAIVHPFLKKIEITLTELWKGINLNQYFDQIDNYIKQNFIKFSSEGFQDWNWTGYKEAKNELLEATNVLINAESKTVDQKINVIIPILKLFKNFTQNFLNNFQFSEWAITRIILNQIFIRSEITGKNQVLGSLIQQIISELKLETLVSASEIGIDLLVTLLQDSKQHLFNKELPDKLDSFNLLAIIPDLLATMGFEYPKACQINVSEKCLEKSSIRTGSFLDKTMNFYELQNSKGTLISDQKEQNWLRIINFYRKLFGPKGKLKLLLFDIEKKLDRNFYYYLNPKNWKYTEEKTETIYDDNNLPESLNLSYVGTFKKNNLLLWKYRFYWKISFNNENDKIVLIRMEKLA